MVFSWFVAMLLVASSAAHAADAPSEKAAWDALRSGGTVVLFRHALAPGGGDPPGFKLEDCSTQRNLSDEGRLQAKRMGERLRAEGVKVQAVWSSQWCRTLETARLMALVPASEIQPKPDFNSLFAHPERQTMQTQAAKRALANFKDVGTLVVVTHQVGITGLTGIVPASGEGVVIRVRASKSPAKAEPEIQVIGRVMP